MVVHQSGIRHIITRFEKTGSVEDRRAYQHARSVRTRETIGAVIESARDEPTTSTRHRSQQLNISRTDYAIRLLLDYSLWSFLISKVYANAPRTI